MTWSETRKKLLALAARRGMHPGEPEGAFDEDPGPGAPFPWSGVVTGAPALEAARGRTPRGEDGRPRDGMARVHAFAVRRPAARLGRGVRAASLCIASGKGGTGKSVVSAGLATLLSTRGRTLVVDADLGVGNAHILQDVSPPHTLVDVVEGRLTVREVLTKCPGQVDLLAGGSGVPRMADLSSYELHLVAEGLEELELDYRYVVVDSAAGVSHQTLAFARACDRTLVVTTPDLTAMTDAYAFLKVLVARTHSRPLLLVNRARSEEQAQEVLGRMMGVCERFLGRAPLPVGWIPEDDLVQRCVNRRGPVTQLEPAAVASQALRKATVAILEELSRIHPEGMGERLMAESGYVARISRGAGETA